MNTLIHSIRMRNLNHTGAMAASIVALTLSSAATAADDLRGVWRATWPNGDQSEVTIVDIDDQGRARGGSCFQTTKGRFSYIDLHPDAILAQLDTADVLRIERPSRLWTFRHDADADVVKMRFQYQKREPHTIDLARVAEQTCTTRVRQLTPPPGATTAPSIVDLIPDDPEHWAVGTWTVTYEGLTVDLAVLDVVDRYALGVYCNLREGPTLGFHDLGPDGIRAKVSRKKLDFKIGNVRFSFKRTKDDDILRRTRRQSGSKQTHDMHRTDEPACASLVTPR